MARFDVVELRVCDDCAMMTANGELGQGDVREDIAHAVRMTVHLGDDWRHLVLGDSDDYDDFSGSRCDGCGSWLAGGRFPAALLLPARG